MTQSCPEFNKPLYKYYAGGSIQDHFYTTDFNELRYGNMFYTYQGIVGYVPK